MDGASEQWTAVGAKGYLTTAVEQEHEQMSVLDRLVDMETTVVDKLSDPAPSSLLLLAFAVHTETRVFCMDTTIRWTIYALNEAQRQSLLSHRHCGRPGSLC